MKEYEIAWKHIEYYMNMNWKLLLGLGASAGSIILIAEYLGSLSETSNSFYVETIIVVFAIMVLWLLGALRNIALADVHTTRMLEIEAYLGLRAHWKEYLSSGELQTDIIEWASRGFQVDMVDAKNETIMTGYDHCPTLLRIVNQKYVDAEGRWEFQIPSSRKLLCIGFLIPLAWILFLLVYLALLPTSTNETFESFWQVFSKPI